MVYLVFIEVDEFLYISNENILDRECNILWVYCSIVSSCVNIFNWVKDNLKRRQSKDLMFAVLDAEANRRE